MIVLYFPCPKETEVDRVVYNAQLFWREHMWLHSSPTGLGKRKQICLGLLVECKL